MGATATFHCPKCGYDTPENLYDAIGYYCEHCNEVYGHFNTSNWIKQVERGEAICKVCNIGILKKWDEICPKCGTEMELNPRATGFYF